MNFPFNRNEYIKVGCEVVLQCWIACISSEWFKENDLPQSNQEQQQRKITKGSKSMLSDFFFPTFIFVRDTHSLAPALICVCSFFLIFMLFFCLFSAFYGRFQWTNVQIKKNVVQIIRVPLSNINKTGHKSEIKSKITLLNMTEHWFALQYIAYLPLLSQ